MEIEQSGAVFLGEKAMKTQFQSHDLTLPAWGPYTKQYSGISHIPAAMDGVRFDLAVFPGIYRRRIDVPNVRYESGYHVWAAAPDLSCYTLRHELEWKDQVYADISFVNLGEDACIVRSELHNHTKNFQNLVLHYMASCHDPVPSYCKFAITGADISLPEGAALLLAKEYTDLQFAVSRPTDNLSFDGMRRAEEPVEGFTVGYGIGQGFGCAAGRGMFGQMMPSGAGDWVRFDYSLEKDIPAPCLGVRYVNRSKESSVYTLNTGETLELPPCEEPQMVFLPLSKEIPAGEWRLELTAAGLGGAKLDCLVLCSQTEQNQVSISIRENGFTPEICADTAQRYVLLKYPHAAGWYGIAWDAVETELRQIENDELDIFLRDTVQDHVHEILRGNGKGHFTNVFQRPIPLAPGQNRTLFAVVCHGTTREQAQALCMKAQRERDRFEQIWEEHAGAMTPPQTLQEGRKFALGQQLMQAVLCTNVVYPVYTRGQYIRHNTPGRWWDCLYTWDSGFIGMGLAQFSLRRGFDCLRAYLTAPGDDEAAFIQHGSMVPTQFYLYAELLNQTGSQALAEYCYPRLMQYYRFISGQAGSSTTANLKSGLLRPWDYFYNSGGWDDYPPQKQTHARRLEASCTPVITTAHVIRCAKILADTAAILKRPVEEAALLADAERLTKALQAYSWDDESGYFGYVCHDAAGMPSGILRDENGQNYNMGLGGASPLFAGACTEAQAQGLWEKLESTEHLWTDCGLSTVDQSASYYRNDGYWNGAVWVPYQWIFFKAALDCGRTAFAKRLALAQLELWEKECRSSYHCFEHFMLESRRGAGWHQFGGLSAPITQFYAGLYRPGTLTTGFDTFVRSAQWSEGKEQLAAVLDCRTSGKRSILAVTAPKDQTVSVSVPEAEISQPWPGLWEICFTVDAPGTVALWIQSEERGSLKI